MDDVGEAANWSAIAQRAFRETVLTLATRKDPNMTNVIERLRASKARATTEAFEAGQACGRRWAETTAEFEELEAFEPYSEIEWEWEGGLETLQKLIDPDGDMHASEWRDFWEKHGNGRSEPNDAFANGFMAGAGALFVEVADEL
ncbi:hypothetical protein [Zavarzinia sp. CC-PAN008]|uniref:hypothetical protein n=1 Tax=Zavarzinia sp. CC-PAN008 TaxID=3243332 RepID=UPI003F7452F5